jgi:hypothetical protein
MTVSERRVRGGMQSECCENLLRDLIVRRLMEGGGVGGV